MGRDARHVQTDDTWQSCNDARLQRDDAVRQLQAITTQLHDVQVVAHHKQAWILCWSINPQASHANAVCAWSSARTELQAAQEAAVQRAVEAEALAVASQERLTAMQKQASDDQEAAAQQAGSCTPLIINTGHTGRRIARGAAVRTAPRLDGGSGVPSSSSTGAGPGWPAAALAGAGPSAAGGGAGTRPCSAGLADCWQN